MSKYKLSPWHDGSVKPVHVGVYESDDKLGDGFYNHWYRLWDGKNWHSGANLKRAAASNRAISIYQDWPWRGILKD